MVGGGGGEGGGEGGTGAKAEVVGVVLRWLLVVVTVAGGAGEGWLADGVGGEGRSVSGRAWRR